MSLFLFFLLLYLVFEWSGVLTLQNTKDYVQSSGPLAGLIIALLLVSDLITPVPSSVLMTLAGSIYGVLWGTIIGSSGSLLSSVIGFFITRRWGKRRLRVIGSTEIRSMNRWFHRWGEGILILSRMIPMLTETMSCFAGLTRIPFKRFLLLIVVGTIPITTFYSYFGSQAQSVSEWSLPLTAGVVVPGITWILLHLKMRREGYVQSQDQ